MIINDIIVYWLVLVSLMCRRLIDGFEREEGATPMKNNPNTCYSEGLEWAWSLCDSGITSSVPVETHWYQTFHLVAGAMI
jgi:hypothetical protein